MITFTNTCLLGNKVNIKVYKRIKCIFMNTNHVLDVSCIFMIIAVGGDRSGMQQET